jgi:integrase
MRLQIKWVNGWAHVTGSGPDGTRVRRALGTRDARQAEEARAALEARLWKTGLYGPGHTVTFAECALAYAKDGGEARFLVKVTAILGERRLQDITPRDVRQAARDAYPDAAAATVNRQGIVPAQAVINYGHAQGWCNPIRVQGLPVPRVRKTAVGRPYLDALRPHLPPRLFALMLFLHITGRRIGDALALRVEDVDLPRLRVIIRDPKNGEPAAAYLTAEAAQLLAEVMPTLGSVFGYAARSSVYATLRRACQKAGVQYLGTHQVGRHSYATALDNAGWSAKAIADAGGWKSPALVQNTYVHPQSPGEKAAALFGKKLASPTKARRKV